MENRILAYAITSNKMYSYSFNCIDEDEFKYYLGLAEEGIPILAILRIKLKKQPVKAA